MTEEEKEIHIRLDLEGDLAKKFNAIKRDKGLTNNTDVLRLLITEAAKEVPKEA